MAAVAPPSQAPHVSTRTTPPMPAHVTAPYTPIHSPHQSVASSVSYRTPVHTLSIHEYRKQQNTPSSGVATPSGRTLRRKAAAPALNTLERVPSTREVGSPRSRLARRPLQPSQSAQQLHSFTASFQFQKPSDQPLRAQSAEPRTHFGSTSTISTSSVKERHFNPRKRLPRPAIATGAAALYLQPTVAKSHAPRRSPRPPALDITTEASYSSDTRTTPTTSTFSLSRFPQPPHLRDSVDSASNKDFEGTQKLAHPFAHQRPVTPPATPATIHYRGASFDLVNPHASLVLHDIVTPSKDFGSSEFLVTPSITEPLVVSSDMAPKRALYGDLNSAHASIMGRAEDSFTSSNLDLPLPPTPAAVSPDSSSYTSPIYSPHSRFAPAPLAVNNAAADSRFSLKSLTRSLTRRLVKAPDTQHAQELQDFHGPNASLSLKNPYISSPQPTYYPLSPASPTTPQSQTFHEDPQLLAEEDEEVELLEKGSPERVYSEPLASLIPDEYSTEIGRAEPSRMSYSSPDFLGRPYYEDADSIYPSSSIYTGDDRRRSAYQQSILSNQRQSKFYSYYGSTNTTDLARMYSPENLSELEFEEQEQAETSALRHASASQSEEKLDTISRIIDQYNPYNITSQANSEAIQEHTEGSDRRTLSTQMDSVPPTVGHSFLAGEPSGFASLDVGSQGENSQSQHIGSPYSFDPSFAMGAAASRELGGPPARPAPLAPPFEYDGPPYGMMRGEPSDLFSARSYSSYGDTRHLLQIPPTHPDPPTAGALQPSSSYSQPTPLRMDFSSAYTLSGGERSPRTPQEALDEAEKIFETMSGDGQKSAIESIPAMWNNRHSGSLLPSASLIGQSDDLALSPGSPSHGRGPPGNLSDGDWESVAGRSPGNRDSLVSIADYSSSESNRDSFGLSITSSPPPMMAQVAGTASSDPLSPSRRFPIPTEADSAAVSPSQLTRLPGLGAIQQNYTPSPWSNPYAFSDKETLELLASGPNDNIMIESGSPQDTVNLHNTGDEGLSGKAADKPYFVNLKGNIRCDTDTARMRGNRASIVPLTSPQTASFSKAGVAQSPTLALDDGPRSPLATTRSPSSPNEKGFASQKASSRRVSLRPALRLSTAIPRSDRRASRTSVPGQTKLREMMLSPGRKTLSSQDTNFSQFMNSSQRPSTADTITPLQPPPTNEDPASLRTVIAHQHSPHLLCPERVVNPEDEERRRKLSWMILAAFCLLPPCIILFRIFGDSVIASLTQGRLGHCTPRSKRVALIAGIAANVGVATIIVIVIAITHALGAV